ncbi:hypothetical protein TIFTF001_044081 [Ficus carica]|uniref:F-box domain-containing protein n=1 Tax=Ficus carica TaxID=3494 RepID=A0AA87Z757_FICCA|nr:hypothetical protein TIFTF001_044050 [Ficus carica]GMN26890.1 hypothetical protein TIFTF001_044051 [Ficus carica]GMN27109.1 hypothetical protein TIFTF001_044077 [Ficus carica]GMN27128.1 hypothetical protein TIFTF001_044081 [Ficus carica]
MAKKRRKVRDGTKEEGQGPKIMAADLISKLPDHVIHHILSFLPTIYAVRMSLLSRCWRRMWYSIPALKFDDHQIKEELFFNFVEQCLKHRQMGMQGNTTSVIARFELRISDYRVDSFQVDRWLSFAARPHLKELIVNAGGMYCMSGFYCLPQFALDLTSLTILNLKFMKLEDISHVNLPSLKSMSFSYVDVEAKVLHNLILRCPSLESCFIEDDEDNETVLPSNLQISRFPLLESLTFKGCHQVDIRHQYLKVLVLEKRVDWVEEVKSEISIDAPNLVCFSYNSSELLQIVMNSPNLLETNITLYEFEETCSME